MDGLLVPDVGKKESYPDLKESIMLVLRDTIEENVGSVKYGIIGLLILESRNMNWNMEVILGIAINQLAIYQKKSIQNIITKHLQYIGF